jgi:hypothetical protein
LAYSLFLTKQSTFPAYFVVEARTYLGSNAPSDSAIDLLLFERLSAATSWKVVVNSQQQDVTHKPLAASIDHPVTDSAGFDTSPLITFPGGAGALSERLSSYMEYWARHWEAPASSIFLPDYWTTDWIRAVASDERNGDPTTGDVVRFYFRSGDSSDAWVVPSQGWAIAFTSVVYTKVSTNPRGWVVQDASQDQFAPALEPGRYTSVVETKVVQPWLYIFPDGKAEVYAINPTIVSIVGYGRRPL